MEIHVKNKIQYFIAFVTYVSRNAPASAPCGQLSDGEESVRRWRPSAEPHGIESKELDHSLAGANIRPGKGRDRLICAPWRAAPEIVKMRDRR